jgi:hypothetical protein
MNQADLEAQSLKIEANLKRMQQTCPHGNAGSADPCPKCMVEMWVVTSGLEARAQALVRQIEREEAEERAKE